MTRKDAFVWKSSEPGKTVRKRRTGRFLPEETYPAYRTAPGEDLLFAGIGAGGGVLLGLLFFKELWGLFLGLPAAYGLLRMGRRKTAARRKSELDHELRDFLLSVVSYLRAGYALENAMIGAEKEIVTMYGAGSAMGREAEIMTRLLRLQTPPERLWEDFGERTGLENGRQLARIFSVAKRQGGDYLPSLKAIVRMMDARSSLREEISALLAGQRLEYLVMCLVPAGMLLYLDLSAPDLTVWLYEPQGHLLMAAVLALYALAVCLGDRILEKSYESE